jgi:3-dehydroquinate dehydratase-2
MKKILVIHGPNLNLLGKREPEVYGKMSLKDINARISSAAKARGATVKFTQTNSESEIVDALQGAMGWADGIILNPGAFTHYSYVIYDAVLACGVPTIEVHLSNIYKREEFRRKSLVAPGCVGQITGFGYRSYLLALSAFLDT